MSATASAGVLPRSLPVTRLRPWAVALALVVVVAGMLAGLLVGPVRLGASSVLRELVGAESKLTPTETAILWQLRFPRVVLGVLVGAALAMAGAAYQGAFRNPLADPYLLGAAAGAGLGATLAVAYLPSAVPIPLAAFAGAVTAVAATYALGRSGGRARTSGTLILAGVAVASLLTAVQTYLQQRRSETLREVFAWILGGLATSNWGHVQLMLPYAIVSAVVLLAHRRLLDVLALGDEEAETVGVGTARVRLIVVLAATLGTAAAVSVSGLIGFVGIIVPHAVRLIAGASSRLVLPLSLAFGGAFCVLADVLARVVMAPTEIPLGVVTAFFGAPFFLVVLRTARRIE